MAEPAGSAEAGEASNPSRGDSTLVTQEGQGHQADLLTSLAPSVSSLVDHRLMSCPTDPDFGGQDLQNTLENFLPLPSCQHICMCEVTLSGNLTLADKNQHIQNFHRATINVITTNVVSNDQVPGTESHDTYPAILNAPALIPQEKSATLTSLKDRTFNLEAMTLAFAAEKGLSFRDVPDLIAYAKAASNDKAALNQVSLDRTTASYKLREGLAPFLRESLLEELRTTSFCLNIDEATSKTNCKVLAVLVSHFSSSENRVVVNHLDAVVLTNATAEILFAELDAIFAKFDLPWENLVSVLMDSCNITHGKKKGLETLIRKKVPGLLDIDGNTCHHAHICAKKFCDPFGGQAEQLLKDLHTDFNWSADMRDKLFDLCHILGIKATSPERYVTHRWLSVLDVSVDTLCLLDAYTVFYSSFLGSKDKEVYTEVVDEVLMRRQVTATGKQTVIDITDYLRNKFSTFTDAGKGRKMKVVKNLFRMRVWTLATLHTYCSILPILKKYVVFFQQKEPMMHLLHSKQHELFNEFCKGFLTPESLEKMPHAVNIKNERNHKSDKHLFIPHKADELLMTREGRSHRKTFKDKLKKAYIACACSLQNKMPINNSALKGCAALAPNVRRTSTTQKYLKGLARIPYLVKDTDKAAYKEEVDTYTTSPKISTETDAPIDVFWSSIDQKQYPLLRSVALKLLSSFHGPAVESSFNTMGEILDAGSSRTDIATYAAIQTVRHSLASREKSSIEMFAKKEPVLEPIPKELTKKMQSAWKANEDRKEGNREAEAQKKLALGAPVHKPPSKRAEKTQLLDENQMEMLMQGERVAVKRKAPVESEHGKKKVQKSMTSFK